MKDSSYKIRLGTKITDGEAQPCISTFMVRQLQPYAAFPPAVGAVLVAVLLFFAGLGMDWMFHGHLPNMPLPPLWMLCIPIALWSLIASVLVYVLLQRIQAEHEAAIRLNHDLRNAMQVLIYIMPRCDAESGKMVADAVARMTATLGDVSETFSLDPSISRRPEQRDPKVAS